MITKFLLHKIFFLLVLISLLVGTSFQWVVQAKTGEQEMDYAQIDAYVQKEMQDAAIPGLAYGIVRGQEIVRLQAFGTADSSGRLVTPQTPFLISSVGKNITALAIQQLAQAGKVSLDMPVQTYLPWFRLADMEAARQITLRQLLDHTSGISNADGTNPEYYRSDRFTNEEIVRSLDQVKLDRPVGSSKEYSNLNYLILGPVIAQVSGQTYEAYVEQHILSPLEMHHTYMSLPEAQADGLAQGHRILFGFITPAQLPYVRGIMSAGNHISTVEDMSHLLIANLNQGNYQDISVLTPDSKPSNKVQQTPFYDVHWIPWETIPTNWTDGQSGEGLDYSGCIYLLPTYHIGVVVLTNANTAETFPTKSAQTIAFDILEMYSGFSGRSTEMSIKTLYIGINTILLAGAGFLVYRVFGLRKWKQKMVRQHEKTGWNLLPTFLVDLGFPIVLLLGLPLVIPPLFAPGLPFDKTWPLFTYTHPDLSYSIWAFSGVLILIGLIKLIWLLKWSRSYTVLILLIVLTGNLLTACAPTQPAIYKTTTWVVEPNLALDALCFIGIMTGDPYYQNYYASEYQRFEPKLTPETRQALAHIYASKQKYGFLISAGLTPIFIKLQPKTLEDLAKALQDPEKLHDPKSLGNWGDSMWQLFLSHVPDLKVIVAWLQDSGFQDDWENNYLPEMKEKARMLTAELPRYNVIPLIEKYARKPLEFNSLTIYLAHYVLPFGVGLDSSHSLFYPQTPAAELVDYTIHEFFHSVIRNVDEDPKLWEALYFVKNDAFYMKNFTDHDPSFGYNTLEEYIEEDVVEAMDQLIAEEAGVAQDAVNRWRNTSPNLQILTPVVYSLLCSEDFANGTETYPEFLIRMVDEGKLKAGMIEAANHKFLGLNQ